MIEKLSQTPGKKSSLSSMDYFNSGVLVFDTKIFHEKISIVELFSAAIFYSHRYYANKSPVQDLLNLVFHGNFYILPNKWNNQQHASFSLKKNKSKIIHFTGERKPWDAKNDYQKSFVKDWWNYALSVFNDNANNRDNDNPIAIVQNPERNHGVIYDSQREIHDLKIEVVYNYIGMERDENKGIPLIYSLRSINKFLKTPHKITIFTDGSLPCEAYRLIDRAVDCVKLGFPNFPESNTARSKDAYLIKNWFSSYAEADYFIYLNDEFMFAAPVDFDEFVLDGKPMAVINKKRFYSFVFPPFPNNYTWAVSNSFHTMQNKLPADFLPVIHMHFAQCYSKGVFAKLNQYFSDEIAQSMSFSVRRNDALVLQTALAVCLKTGGYVEKKLESDEAIHIFQAKTMPPLTKRLKFICFNNDWYPVYSEVMENILARK
jgi:lipopolysaccharide biosynthesis glycosyltransferase